MEWMTVHLTVCSYKKLWKKASLLELWQIGSVAVLAQLELFWWGWLVIQAASLFGKVRHGTRLNIIHNKYTTLSSSLASSNHNRHTRRENRPRGPPGGTLGGQPVCRVALLPTNSPMMMMSSSKATCSSLAAAAASCRFQIFVEKWRYDDLFIVSDKSNLDLACCSHQIST